MKNRIIRTSREGWILVDISTPKYPDAVMYIDADDWEYIQSLGYGKVSIAKFRKSEYAICTQNLGSKMKRHYIHRLLLPNSKMVDHENTNGLDNRRSNLRDCTKSQNGMNTTAYCHNTSGVKGVSWNSQMKKWKANIKVKGKGIFLGYHSLLEDAAEARRTAEEKHFGNFANI